MIEIVGLIGGALFAYAAVPAAIQTIKVGKSIGTPILIAWAIFLGSIIMYAYLKTKYGFDWVLTINYTVETFSWLIIVCYHYFPRKKP